MSNGSYMGSGRKKEKGEGGLQDPNALEESLDSALVQLKQVEPLQQRMAQQQQQQQRAQVQAVLAPAPRLRHHVSTPVEPRGSPAIIPCTVEPKGRAPDQTPAAIPSEDREPLRLGRGPPHH